MLLLFIGLFLIEKYVYVTAITDNSRTVYDIIGTVVIRFALFTVLSGNPSFKNSMVYLKRLLRELALFGIRKIKHHNPANDKLASVRGYICRLIFEFVVALLFFL